MQYPALLISHIALHYHYIGQSEFLHPIILVFLFKGKKIMCLGNTENLAGSDVAGISMTAEKVGGGWVLNGSKAYVTNGYIADLGVFTAVSDPQAARNSRLSIFREFMNIEGVD